MLRNMPKLKIVGVLFALAGVGFLAAGPFIALKAQAGLASLEAVYKAQNVTMTYDDNGTFTDRGTVEGGSAILHLLTDTWQFPLNMRNLDPADPLVNTPDELMVQYARITYHTLHSTVNVTLDKEVEYQDQVFATGTYAFDVDGRYWLDFDRMHPIEGVARDSAWTGATHGTLANLAAGTVTHNFALFVLGFGVFVTALGALFLLVGILFFLAGRKELVHQPTQP